MSCDLRQLTVDALRDEALGIIQKARANVEIYLHHPAGIGEHPDVLAAIQDQLDVIAKQEERIDVINKYFVNHEHD